MRLHGPRKVQVHTAQNSGSLGSPGSHSSLWRSLGFPVANLVLESSRKLSCGEVSGFPGGNFELWRALGISRRITFVHKALQAKLLVGLVTLVPQSFMSLMELRKAHRPFSDLRIDITSKKCAKYGPKFWCQVLAPCLGAKLGTKLGVEVGVKVGHEVGV